MPHSLKYSCLLEEQRLKLAMTVPRVFWVTISLALLLVALSAAHFFLVSLPAAQRRRDELAADNAKQQLTARQIADCAEQSRRAGADFSRYSSGAAFGLRESIAGVSNHFNRKLGKCIVDVQTVDKNGTSEYVMDAYEESSLLWCSNRLTPKLQRTCMDSHNIQINPGEADRQIDALLRE